MPVTRALRIVAAIILVAAWLPGHVATSFAASPPAPNYQGIWWASPAGSESGWGINFAHQGDTIFATWFTYGRDGKPLWLVAALSPTAPNVYAGDLYTGTGPPYTAAAFDPALLQPVKAGTATLTFADGNSGAFSYALYDVSQTKAITRQVVGDRMPTCIWGGPGDPAAATNYQDMWWASPAGSESGWGVNFAHQGDTIFAAWFTYGTDGKALWMVAAANRTAPMVYAGTLFTGTGPAFDAVPFDTSKVAGAAVGTVTITFTDGVNATFAYTVNGVGWSKAITRQVFQASSTVCRYAQGIWRGTTSDEQDARAIILDDGTWYIIYREPDGGIDLAIAQGSGRADGGQFSSPDGVIRPIARAAETGDIALDMSLAGTYVPFGALQLATADMTRGSRTLAATFESGSAQAGNLTAAAGSYSGISGHAGGRRIASFTVDATGKINAHNDICGFTGTAVPLKSMNAFELTFQSNGSCVFGRYPIYGIAFYDDATRKFYGLAPYNERDLFYLIGTK